MLDLSDLESYQKISCFADSFCYLTDEDELEQAFGQVEKHLKEGGQFLVTISPIKRISFIQAICITIRTKNKHLLGVMGLIFPFR